MDTPKKYIAVPAVSNGLRQCADCAWGPLPLSECLRNWRMHGFGGSGLGCTSPRRIAIEDTPEGHAAYVAAKLES